jgi:hypothetical protein
MEKIIEITIKKNIMDELLKHKSKYNVDDTEYIKFCKDKINIYMKQIKLKNNPINKRYNHIFKKKKNMCNARLWSDGYGSRCSHTIIKNNLCKVHNNIIDKYGKLRFDTINNDKPKIDCIKLNVLQWK